MRVILIFLVAVCFFASCSTKIGPFDWELDADTAQLEKSEEMKKPFGQTKTDQENSETIAKNKIFKSNQKKDLSIQDKKGGKETAAKPPEPLMEVKKAPKMEKNKQKVKHTIPLWILNGGKYDPGTNENYLYSVGMATNSQSDLVLKTRSEDKARENLIGKIYEFKAIMDHEIESNSQELKSLTDEDTEELKSVIFKITSTFLVKVELPETWKNPMKSEQYTLARLNLAPFKKAYQETSTLGRFAKTYLKIIFEKSWRAYNLKMKDGYIFTKNGKRYVLKDDRYYFY